MTFDQRGLRSDLLLTDRRLAPDLLLPDPPTWVWPFPCHRHGHVWVVGKMFCGECGASWHAWGDYGRHMEEVPFTQRPYVDGLGERQWRVPEVVTEVEGFGMRYRSVRRG